MTKGRAVAARRIVGNSFSFDRIIGDAAYPIDRGRAAAMRKRKRDFDDERQMQLALIAMNPEAREIFDRLLEQHFKQPIPLGRFKEVIIGGGLHAAVYSAIRVQTGHEPPLIIERKRAGGVFAQAHFWMNSRNRPGPPGLPSEGANLNNIPGAPVQLSHISTDTFPASRDMAYVIRSALALYGRFHYGDVISVSVDKVNKCFKLNLAKGIVYADRVIDARGAGDPKPVLDDDRVMNGMQFMARMEKPFPMQDLGRVAVVGSGDFARCVIEALLGLGPGGHMSVPALDYIEQVDWYAPDLATTCKSWRERERGRYQAIASLLQPLDNGRQRLRIFPIPGATQKRYNGVYVCERLYDHVISAKGWQLPLLAGDMSPTLTAYYGDTPQLARTGLPGYFAIGVAADLPFTPYETGSVAVNATGFSTTRLKENRVAIFRLADRSATLAAQLA